MNKKIKSALGYSVVLLLTLVVACDDSSTPKYKNASLPIETRINDLMSRMTLEEKAAQLDMLSDRKSTRLNSSH